MSDKKENLNYASLSPDKKKKADKREVVPEPLKLAAGSRRKPVRLGRGRPSGKGKTSGKGQKGQKSRTGYSRRAGFEGGQMPLHRRLPKRGFTNIFKKQFQLVNLVHLDKAGLSGDVAPADLVKAGLIKDADKLVKILGNGDLKSGLKISADAFSESAKKKIEAAGGSATVREKVKKEKKADPGKETAGK